MNKKKLWMISFFLYTLLIIRLIIFKYPTSYIISAFEDWDIQKVLDGIKTANLVFFRTIGMYLKFYNNLNGFANLFGNILIFIPFGCLLPMSFQSARRFISCVSYSFIFIAAIEIFQVISTLGVFDVDDILLNCFGVMIGYFCFYFFQYVLTMIGRNNKNGSARTETK